MSYPQQPGNYSDPSWPTPNQPYSDPGPGYGAYPGYPASATPASPGYGYGYGYGPPVPMRRTNGLAIAAMVVSIAGIFVACGYPGIIGAIMGHVARRQIRERGEDGDGMALAGVIVGWISFAIIALITVLYIVALVFGIWWANEAASNYDYEDPYPYPS